MIKLLLLLFILSSQKSISPHNDIKGTYTSHSTNIRQPHTGVDEFGYHWIDSYEPSGPVYNWVEITTNPISGDDINIGPLALPAPFWFYGNTFDSIRICSNGWISFTSSSNIYNVSIPYIYEPNNTIAVFACDLYPGYYGYGSMYYGAVDDGFVVMWDSVHGYNGDGPYKFEIILNPSDSSILYQYHSSPNWQARVASIGIEDEQGEVGLTAFQDNVINQYAIKFYWIEPPDSNVGVVEQLAPTDGNLLVPGIPVNLQLRVKNRGQTTLSFPVVCLVDSSGTVVYSDIQNVNNLSGGAKTNITFSAWTPAEFFDYNAILYTNLAGDPICSDDTLYKRLKAPGAFSDSCVWDNGIPANGYYYYSNNDVIASEFVPPYYPCLLRYVSVYCLSEGDPYWPWPDSTHDPIQIGIWFDHNHDSTPDEPSVWLESVQGDSITPSWVYSVPEESLVINYGNFWVGIKNLYGRGTEAICVDGFTDYPAHKWRREDSVWEHQDYCAGDHMIRAYVTLANLLAHDVRPLRIVEPDSITYTDTVIVPRVLIMNSGVNTETFPVRFIIKRDFSTIYNETVNVTNLGSRDTMTVSFPPWNPYHLPGEYSTQAITELTGDLDPNNDTLFKEIEVRIYEWKRIASMPERRMHHATVYSPFNDKIYVIGGSVYYYGPPPNATKDNCWEYDPLADIWTIKSPMPYRLNFIYGAYCNKKIYIIGGYDSTCTAVTTNLIYDIENDMWYEGAPFPIFSTAAGARVTWRDSLIYCMGGVIHDDRGVRVQHVYLYNPEQDTFHECTPLPYWLFYSGTACILDDKVYILGGGIWLNTPLDSIIAGAIQILQPDSINWTLIDTLPYPLYVNSVDILNDKVYIIGGRAHIPTPIETNKVWEYDPVSCQYSALPDHPLPRICGQQFMAVKPDSQRIYTMGGDTVFVEMWPHSGEGTASCFKLIKHELGIIEKENYYSTLQHPLISAFPNPFANKVKILFSVSKKANVKLKIYNICGQRVKTLTDFETEIGKHKFVWNGKDDNNRELPTGVYFVRLETPDISITKKIIKLK